MKTEETNKLIAEFMGIDVAFDGTFSINPMTRYGCWEKMKYATDWNWLMEVVEKIESLGVNIWVVKNKVKITIIGELAQKLNNSLYDTEFEGYDFEYYTKETKIEAVYNACVTFIEWYNSADKN